MPGRDHPQYQVQPATASDPQGDARRQQRAEPPRSGLSQPFAHLSALHAPLRPLALSAESRALVMGELRAPLHLPRESGREVLVVRLRETAEQPAPGPEPVTQEALCRGVSGSVRAGLPFASDTFDAVVSVPLLRTITNPRAVLREVSRVLRPGGRLLARLYCVSGSSPEDFAFTRVAADYGLPVLEARAIVDLLEGANLGSVTMPVIEPLSLSRLASGGAPRAAGDAGSTDPAGRKVGAGAADAGDAETWSGVAGLLRDLGYEAERVNLALVLVDAVCRG